MPRAIRDALRAPLSDPSRWALALCECGSDAEESESVECMLPTLASWSREHLAVAPRNPCEGAERLHHAAELGLFGLTIPERHGGAGLSLKAAGRVLEEVGRGDASIAVSIGLHCAQGTQGLVAFGSDEQKARLLPRLASGEWVAAFAATEPMAGSDLSGVRTTATRSADGSLELSGSKLYVTNGAYAEVFSVLAQTPGLFGVRRGQSLFLVRRGAPGLAIGREEHKLGLRGSSTVPLQLDRVPVGEGDVLGVPGRAMSHVAELLSQGRVLVAFGSVGAGRAACERARSHVLTRHQFQRPLARFGLVREAIAGMRTRIYAMESVARLAGQLAAERDVGWESAVAKIYCSEASWWIADTALQLHGGAGFLEETGVARWLRDARITRIFEGSNELLRFHVASGALLFPEDRSEPPRALAESLHPDLRDQALCFDALLASLHERLEPLALRLGSSVLERQVPLRGIADAAAGLYVWLAALLRTQGELAREGAADSLSVSRLLGHGLAADVEAALLRADAGEIESLIDTISDAEFARVAA